MFTGIITAVGTVRRVERSGGARFTISAPYRSDQISLGVSICCNGCCLTVVNSKNGELAFDVSHETLDVTTLKNWREGTQVNLERSLRLGDELGGHVVSGHVDGIALISRIAPDGDSLRFTFAAPEKLAKFIASKGSVALDGTSLTVNEIDGSSFGVNIIPHTRQVTTWGAAKEGDAVNIEIDMLARYVARLAEFPRS